MDWLRPVILYGPSLAPATSLAALLALYWFTRERGTLLPKTARDWQAVLIVTVIGAIGTVGASNAAAPAMRACSRRAASARPQRSASRSTALILAPSRNRLSTLW